MKNSNINWTRQIIPIGILLIIAYAVIADKAESLIALFVPVITGVYSISVSSPIEELETDETDETSKPSGEANEQNSN